MNLKKAYGKVNRREFWKAMQVYEIEKPLGYFGKSMREVGNGNKCIFQEKVLYGIFDLFNVVRKRFKER